MQGSHELLLDWMRRIFNPIECAVFLTDYNEPIYMRVLLNEYNALTNLIFLGDIFNHAHSNLRVRS